VTGDGGLAVRLSAVVLAGGASTRFGGDKLAADLDGRPVLEHALRAAAVVADPVVVVVGPDDPTPRIPGELGVRVVMARDGVARQGPLAGLGSGLAMLAGLGTDGAGEGDEQDEAGGTPALGVVIVVAGDMPTLLPGVLRLLALTMADDPALGAAYLEADPPSPLPCAVRASLAGPAAARLLAGGRRSLRGLFGALPTAVVPADAWRALDPDALTLRDIDTPADLHGG
jgi:molybdopterin-guanine dinucleotide biosynthesis protein A